MLLGTLGESLLGNMLPWKGIVTAGCGNRKGQGLIEAGYGNRKDKGIVRAGYGNRKRKGIVRAGVEMKWIFSAASSFNKFLNTKVLSKWT